MSERLVLFIVLTGHPRTPSDIARILGLRQSSVSTLITSLEERQLVKRHAAAADRRSVMILATKKSIGLRSNILSQ